MISGIARWVDTRLNLGRSSRNFLNHVFPDHWSFMLGEIALYSFLLLILTGIFLVLFFNASAAPGTYEGSYTALRGVSASAAYRSVLRLSFDVPAGLLMRQMHHWAALIFVAAIVLHLCRIFFTAAYRKPREINWLIGVTLLLFAIANGFFGYSVPDDLLSGTGVHIGYAILLSTPVIGPWMTFLFFGGTPPTSTLIPRMYALHIFIIPAILAILIAVHLFIVWRQLHTNYPGPGRTDRSIVGSRLWPGYTAKSIGLCFLVFGVIAILGGLVQINPIWIYGPNHSSSILPGAQPDWYLGWVEGAMRLFPGVNLHFGRWLVPEVFFPALLFPALVFLGLYCYPFLERWFGGDEEPHSVLKLPYERPAATAFGCAVLMFLLVLFFAGSDDVIAVITGGSVVTIRQILRILVFVAPAVTAVLAYGVCASMRRHAISHAR